MIFTSVASRARRVFVRAALALSLGSAAAAALAAPVVVGSFDPATRKAVAFYDILVSSFADGTPITKLYIGYSTISNGFFFVRSGHPGGHGCRTEVFRLVPISGNRLAIADPMNPNLAWGVRPIPTKMYATFDCTSSDCFDCQSSQDPLGAGTNLDQPHCVCADAGTCTTNQPGTGGAYGPGQIVIQAP